MWGYTARDVARMLELPVAQVRSFVRAGLLEPARGPRGELRFSFQDLVLLRTAKGLRAAAIPTRRMKRALAKLRAQLAPGRPLTGVKIAAENGRIVVHDDQARWQADSGQVLFDFGVAELAREVAPLLKQAKHRAMPLSADDFFAWGCDLEDAAPEQAREAYARALELDPEHASAHINLGRLLHEAGDLAPAEAHYRRACALAPDDATAAFNLGVVLEDLGRFVDAVGAYQAALRADAAYADAHYNLAGLLEQLGRQTDAFRHLKAYRKLRGR
jgi:tetratricopeptide (TPR) repeat protein